MRIIKALCMYDCHDLAKNIFLNRIDMNRKVDYNDKRFLRDAFQLNIITENDE